MKFIDTDTQAIYKVLKDEGLYRTARMRPDEQNWRFVTLDQTPWRQTQTEAEADLLNLAIERNLKRLED